MRMATTVAPSRIQYSGNRSVAELTSCKSISIVYDTKSAREPDIPTLLNNRQKETHQFNNDGPSERPVRVRKEDCPPEYFPIAGRESLVRMLALPEVHRHHERVAVYREQNEDRYITEPRDLTENAAEPPFFFRLAQFLQGLESEPIDLRPIVREDEQPAKKRRDRSHNGKCRERTVPHSPRGGRVIHNKPVDEPVEKIFLYLLCRMTDDNEADFLPVTGEPAPELVYPFHNPCIIPRADIHVPTLIHRRYVLLLLYATHVGTSIFLHHSCRSFFRTFWRGGRPCRNALILPVQLEQQSQGRKFGE